MIMFLERKMPVAESRSAKKSLELSKTTAILPRDQYEALGQEIAGMDYSIQAIVDRCDEEITEVLRTKLSQLIREYGQANVFSILVTQGGWRTTWNDCGVLAGVSLHVDPVPAAEQIARELMQSKKRTRTGNPPEPGAA